MIVVTRTFNIEMGSNLNAVAHRRVELNSVRVISSEGLKYPEFDLSGFTAQINWGEDGGEFISVPINTETGYVIAGHTYSGFKEFGNPGGWVQKSSAEIIVKITNQYGEEATGMLEVNLSCEWGAIKVGEKILTEDCKGDGSPTPYQSGELYLQLIHQEDQIHVYAVVNDSDYYASARNWGFKVIDSIGESVYSFEHSNLWLRPRSAAMQFVTHGLPLGPTSVSAINWFDTNFVHESELKAYDAASGLIYQEGYFEKRSEHNLEYRRGYIKNQSSQTQRLMSVCLAPYSKLNPDDIFYQRGVSKMSDLFGESDRTVIRELSQTIEPGGQREWPADYRFDSGGMTGWSETCTLLIYRD